MNLIADLRQFKIGQFAVFDLAVSYIGVYILAPLLTKLFAIFRIYLKRNQWLWLTLPVSVIVHLLTKQMTPLTKMAFDPTGFYLEKIGLLLMLYMGLKDCFNPKNKS